MGDRTKHAHLHIYSFLAAFGKHPAFFVGR
jgi:hypothetical protein